MDKAFLKEYHALTIPATEGKMQESEYLEGRQDLLGKLKSIPVLGHFDDASLMKILGLSKIRRYEPGEAIINQGDMDYWIYFLLGGKVKVETHGREVAQLDAYGTLFGEMSVVDNTCRSATVSALVPTMCLAIDAKVMDQIDEWKRDRFAAVLFRFIAEVLSERLRRKDIEMAKLKDQMHGQGSGQQAAANS
jgi:CRP-like cAMP-binding protein